MINFSGILGKIIKEVAKRNSDRPDVKTADPVVFEDMQKHVEAYEKTEAPQKTSRSDMYKGMAERMKQAQKENEANPNVETAHSSVFEDMLQEIENLKQKVEAQGDREIPQPNMTTGSVGMQAITNSQRGSLSVRQNPEMGAAKFDMRIPDKTLLKVLDYSNNTINLDGKTSRFVLVEYNGQKGWILEAYLNFN